MIQIISLAPTILDAMHAIERGCRKIQSDPCYSPDMGQWLFISNGVCIGCLATCTLLQLTNKSPKDIVDQFVSPSGDCYLYPIDRAEAYGLQPGKENVRTSDLCTFEMAIDSLLTSDIAPLLEFYGLENHVNAKAAIEWLLLHQPDSFERFPTHATLLEYADFLKDQFIPLLTTWFAPGR